MLTPFSQPRAAYVHVPFCAHRCGYCDFTLVAGKDHLVDAYLAALEQELSVITDQLEIDTLFFGGGTPTHLTAGQLRRLLALVRSRFRLAEGYEFSVEANPFGLTAEKVGVLADFGVNRVSLGVQSFSADVLAILERDHREPDILAAIENLRGRIENIGLDLIFAVPGQSLEDWRHTLLRAVELEPDHVSTYGLTFEKGTAFWSRRKHGVLRSADEELERTMYESAMDSLPACGLEQYELSNFARPGRACRHNETYWLGLPYYGFGPGAASYRDGVRRTNHRSVTTWIRRVLAGESGVQLEDELTTEDRAREAIWLGLRRTQGIDRSVYRERFGIDLDALAGDGIHRLSSRGLIADDGPTIRLTREGRLLADSVAEAFL
jgi:oxygen-independent coproporphyrinogen-3 oxidase